MIDVLLLRFVFSVPPPVAGEEVHGSHYDQYGDQHQQAQEAYEELSCEEQLQACERCKERDRNVCEN